jgi:hypothetical protein
MKRKPRLWRSAIYGGSGMAIGAALGLLFGIVGSLVGAVGGAVIGMVWELRTREPRD